MFSAGFGCSLLVLSVLGQFWVFSASFGCFWLVLGVLGFFWCCWLVLGVLGRFLVFAAGFECSLPVLGVLGLAILELLHLCNSVKNFGSILMTKDDERSLP